MCQDGLDEDGGATGDDADASGVSAVLYICMAMTVMMVVWLVLS